MWFWFRDHKAIGIIGLILSLLALAFSAIAFWAPQWITSEKPLALNEQGTVGPVSIRVTAVECNKSVEDLSHGYQELLKIPLPEGESLENIYEGQLCLVDTEIRNDSNTSISVPALWGTLIVQENTYDFAGIDQSSRDPLTIFPDGSQQVRYIFDIPEGVTPTGLEFAWTDPDDGDDISVDV
jgi:hypothetical protein